MTTKTRRQYSRQSIRVPILYAGYSSTSYKKAVMYNSCKDGMYFESNLPLQPKFDLYIKTQRHRSGSFERESYKAFRARVKWCRQVAGEETPRYGVGVQYIAKSHLLYGVNARGSDYPCDYCEKMVSGKLLHQTETGIVLCPDCLHYMETLPRGSEKVLERFLMGNVV